MMKHHLASHGSTAVALLCALVFFCAVTAPGEDLTLAPNRTSRIPVTGKIKKVIVANERIADAHVASDGSSVLVTALGTGTSEIRIELDGADDMIYQLSVKADLTALAADIGSLLEGVEGISVKVVGERVVLDGNVVTMSDYDRVQKIVAAYTGVILNLTKLDRTELNRIVADAIEKDIALPTVKVKVSGDTATLEGMVFDPQDAAMAMEKAKLRCPNVNSLLRLEEVMIETDVYFVMIETSTDKGTGVNLLNSLSLEASGTTSDGGMTYSVAGGLMAKINAMVGEGKAKFLAKPHLSTKSGASAKFLSGGEVFFKVQGQADGSLEKIEHGVILTVKPVLKGQDRILDEISIEVSVPSPKAQGVFSLDKYHTSSTVMCKVGESILVSGLSQTLETQFKDKTPLLGSIPVLSMFFNEKGKKNSQRDMVVVLTPRPVFPAVNDDPANSEASRKLIE